MIPDHDEAPILAAVRDEDLHAFQTGVGSKVRHDEDLLGRLAEAQTANMHARPCQVCDALGRMSDAARAGVEAALAGTIGERTLAQILTDSGYITGRRAVQNHRREAHTP